MKKLISAVIAVIMLLAFAPAVIADTDILYSAYAKQGIEMLNSGAYIEGNVVVESGYLDASEWHNWLRNGIVYLNNGASFKNIPGNTGSPLYDIYRKAVYGDFVISHEIKYLNVPENLENKGSLKLDWRNSSTAPYIIDTDSHFDTLDLDNWYLQVNVPTDEIRFIEADTLKSAPGGTLSISGGGKVVIIVKKLNVTGAKLNLNGNSDDLLIYFKEDEDAINFKNFAVKGHIYSPPGRKLIYDGNANAGTYKGVNINIFGNLYVNGEVEIKSSVTMVGNIYAPNTKVELFGNSCIFGLVYAKNIKMYGSGKILGPGNDNFEIDLIKALLANEEPEDPQEPEEEPQEPQQPFDPNFPSGKEIKINYPYGYLYGYSHGAVGANDSIKRQEAATLIYRLLKQDNKLGGFTPPRKSQFTDLTDEDWSFNALSYMVYIGVYPTSGDKYPIKPNEGITRGEIAKLISYSFRIRPTDEEIDFPDLDSTHPYYYYIKALVNHENEILKGYEDGTISPDQVITRAEFIAIINRVIERDERYNVAGVDNPYPDLKSTHWAYNDLIRASYGYQTEPDDNGIYQVDPNGKPDRSTLDYN